MKFKNFIIITLIVALVVYAIYNEDTETRSSMDKGTGKAIGKLPRLDAQGQNNFAALFSQYAGLQQNYKPHEDEIQLILQRAKQVGASIRQDPSIEGNDK